TYPETRQTPIYKPLVKFIIVSCLGLAIRIPLFAWLEKVLIPLAEKTIPNVLTPTIVGHNLSLAIVIGVVMLWNFFVNRFWTFKSVPA
ncbi:MAG: GtrA family protein, partial [Anaerolineaceae bacterium]|nr:GtrA family protein [Anaerolineaceae bacterium]